MRSDDIRIPEPCHEDWGRMLPEERGWHCKLCTKHVHDLTRMTEKQVRALLQSGQDVCVAYDIDAIGNIVFAPEPVVPISRLVRKPVAVAAAGLALALAACTPHGEDAGERLDAPEVPTHVQSSPVIPEGEREPDPPMIEVEVQEPEVEPCEKPEPTVDTPPIRHTRGAVAMPVPMLKGKPARSF